MSCCKMPVNICWYFKHRVRQDIAPLHVNVRHVLWTSLDHGFVLFFLSFYGRKRKIHKAFFPRRHCHSILKEFYQPHTYRHTYCIYIYINSSVYGSARQIDSKSRSPAKLDRSMMDTLRLTNMEVKWKTTCLRGTWSSQWPLSTSILVSRSVGGLSAHGSVQSKAWVCVVGSTCFSGPFCSFAPSSDIGACFPSSK